MYIMYRIACLGLPKHKPHFEFSFLFPSFFCCRGACDILCFHNMSAIYKCESKICNLQFCSRICSSIIIDCIFIYLSAKVTLFHYFTSKTLELCPRKIFQNEITFSFSKLCFIFSQCRKLKVSIDNTQNTTPTILTRMSYSSHTIRVIF